MQNNPKPFELYKHFKGNTYQIITVAEHSETREKMVVYQALYGDFKTYVRPLSMFIEEVDLVKYPMITQKYRFEYIDQSSLVQDNQEPVPELLATPEVTPVPAVIPTSAGSAVPAAIPTSAGSAVPAANSVTAHDFESDNEEEFQLSPLLMKFLDADSYEDKLNILVTYHNQITQDAINTMAASLDIEVKDGDLEERYEEVKNCLLMLEKFECNRLR